jgi:hypothetical protein
MYIEIESNFYQNRKAVLSHFATNQTFNSNDNIMYSRLNSLITKKHLTLLTQLFKTLSQMKILL